MRVRRPSAAVAALVLFPMLAAQAGCSGEADSKSGSRSASESATPYLPVPTAVDLTEEGEELGWGGSATVAWEPRQDVVGVLDVRVDSAERTTFEQSFKDWKVADQVKAYTPYFVRGEVTNAGETDLGGVAVPLYGVSDADALVESSTFATTFKPCHPNALPAPFGPGKSAAVCLVVLVPNGGSLTGVAFRPSDEVEPITWTGPIATITPSPTAKPKKKR